MNKSIFDISGSVAVVTGGGGVLGSNIVKSLLKAGTKVIALDIRQEAMDERIGGLKEGGEVSAMICNVLDMDSLRNVRKDIVDKWGRIDILINAAGGNIPGATLNENQTIFDMKMEDFNKVNELNMNGTVCPSIVFGEAMARAGKGSIICQVSQGCLVIRWRRTEWKSSPSGWLPSWH